MQHHKFYSLLIDSIIALLIKQNNSGNKFLFWSGEVFFEHYF